MLRKSLPAPAYPAYLCPMPLTEHERNFLEWWPRQRDRQRKLSYQLWLGLPLGLAFALPILLNFLAGRFWYKRADAVGASQFNPFILTAALLIIAGFTGFLHRKFKWEENEQRYLSFMAKKEKEEAEKGQSL